MIEDNIPEEEDTEIRLWRCPSCPWSWEVAGPFDGQHFDESRGIRCPDFAVEPAAWESATPLTEEERLARTPPPPRNLQQEIDELKAQIAALQQAQNP